MPAEKGTVRVHPIPGEKFRYRVESWSHPGMGHTVDLLAHGGNGDCDCTDNHTVCARNRKLFPGHFIDYGTPKHKNPNRTRCRHITACCKHQMDSILRDQAPVPSHENDP